MPLSDQDLIDLTAAKQALENPGLAARMTDLLGGPIEHVVKKLPEAWREKIQTTIQDALMASLKGAIGTINKKSVESYPWWHKAAVVASGSIGGAFGLPALIVELPISTTIMMRSIADIARAHGENLSTLETQLACLSVFAFGGRDAHDAQAKHSYFASRMALARSVTEAMEYFAEKAILEEAAPAIIRLVAVIAARFEVQVSEKAALQLVPGISAAFGGAVNYLFIDHFQTISHGQFTVRRLERAYGEAEVRKAYEALPA